MLMFFFFIYFKMWFKIYIVLVVILYDFDDFFDSKDGYGDQFDYSIYILYVGC